VSLVVGARVEHHHPGDAAKGGPQLLVEVVRAPRQHAAEGAGAPRQHALGIVQQHNQHDRPCLDQRQRCLTRLTCHAGRREVVAQHVVAADEQGGHVGAKRDRRPHLLLHDVAHASSRAGEVGELAGADHVGEVPCPARALTAHHGVTDAEGDAIAEGDQARAAVARSRLLAGEHRR